MPDITHTLPPGTCMILTSREQDDSFRPTTYTLEGYTDAHAVLLPDSGRSGRAMPKAFLSKLEAQGRITVLDNQDEDDA